MPVPIDSAESMTGVGDLEHLLLAARADMYGGESHARSSISIAMCEHQNRCSKMIVPKVDFTFETFLVFGTNS